MKRSLFLAVMMLTLLAVGCSKQQPVQQPEQEKTPVDTKPPVEAVIPDNVDEPEYYPIPTGEIYGLTGEDAVLYDAVAEYLGNDRKELMLPSLTVYGSYTHENGEKHYICGLLRLHYYDLVLSDTPTYSSGSAGNLARIAVNKEGICTEIMETLDGADNTERINEMCGPLTEIADALNAGEESTLEKKVLVPKSHEDLLTLYIEAYF